MPDTQLDTLRRALDLPRMMAHLGQFARRVKLSGSAEEAESFAYLEVAMRSYGYRTRLIRHDAYISLPGRAAVEVDGKALRCITHSFSRPSPPGGITAELVHVGAGRAEDFAGRDLHGRIALIEGLAAPGPSLRASEAGAVGQLHVSAHEHLHEMCISPVWGSPTPETRARLPRTVVTTIAQADGAALIQRLRAGERLHATLQAEVDTGWRTTPLLEAELPVPDGAADGPFVLFSGHHDTWHLGVMDNGAANATMLEVARLCATQRAAWRRGLRFCFWSGHSHGRYSGSTWYADHRWSELEARCVAHVNCDSTGARGNTVLADAQASAELRRLGAAAVREEGGQEMTGLRMSRAGDSSFWGIGIPSLFMAMGEQPAGGGQDVMAGVLAAGGPVKQGAGLGWWWHTPEDTLDKIDPDLLARDTRIYLHAVWRLLTDAVLPLDYAEACADLDRALAPVAAALGDRLPLTPLRERVAALGRRAAALRDGGNASGANAALLRLGRALVPLDYTSGDRFDHDPALPQAPYPILDPLRRLAALPDSTKEAKFAEVAAVRALNRLIHAIDQATAAASSLEPATGGQGRS